MSGAYFMLQFLKKERLMKKQKFLNKNRATYKENKLERSKINKGKCRICLKEGKNPIYSSESSFSLEEAIRTFCGIDLSESDEYPKYLCTKCHTFLADAVVFRKTAQETAKLLNQTEDLDSVADLVTADDTDDCNGQLDDHIIKTYICNLCKQNFKTLNELIAHKKSKSHRKVRIQCSMCYRLLTPQLYKKHLARHQSTSHLVCDICGKLYRKDNLIRHLQLHSFDLPFQCQICPYRGRFMESLKIHMRTHTGDKPFSCDKCELRFLTRSNLNRHLLSHKKDRPFKCLECGRGFYTKRDMDVHFKADHAGLKEFGCQICGNKYGTRKALMRHELRVHKRDKMAKGRMPLYLQAGYEKQNEVTD